MTETQCLKFIACSNIEYIKSQGKVMNMEIRTRRHQDIQEYGENVS
jgi:hypothetical protein